MRFVKKIPRLQLLTQKRLGQKMPISQHLLICYVRKWFKMESNQWKALIFHTLLFISTLAQIIYTVSAFMLMCLNLHSVGVITQKVCKFLRCLEKKWQNQKNFPRPLVLTVPTNIMYRVSQKNALSESCWSHSVVAQSQVAGTLCAWKIIFWSFLTKNKPDQAFPSHFHDKN